MHILFEALYIALNFYLWVVVISAILSWLIAFDVVNTGNRFVYVIYDVTSRLTEPVYRQIRRVIPSFGGVDLSPLVVLLIIYVLQRIIVEYGIGYDRF